MSTDGHAQTEREAGVILEILGFGILCFLLWVWGSLLSSMSFFPITRVMHLIDIMSKLSNAAILFLHECIRDVCISVTSSRGMRRSLAAYPRFTTPED